MPEMKKNTVNYNDESYWPTMGDYDCDSVEVRPYSLFVLHWSECPMPCCLHVSKAVWFNSYEAAAGYIKYVLLKSTYCFISNSDYDTWKRPLEELLTEPREEAWIADLQRELREVRDEVDKVFSLPGEECYRQIEKALELYNRYFNDYAACCGANFIGSTSRLKLFLRRKKAPLYYEDTIESLKDRDIL